MRRRRPLNPYQLEDIVTVAINDLPEEAREPALKILLLEDRSDFRGILHDYLASQSHEVTSVYSGVEGVREIMKTPFDLLICDMMMPKMGGEMFYWAVTKVRPGARQRFIFFSGHRNNPALESFFAKVGATVLYKPFSLAALSDAIKAVFRKMS